MTPAEANSAWLEAKRKTTELGNAGQLDEIVALLQSTHRRVRQGKAKRDASTPTAPDRPDRARYGPGSEAGVDDDERTTAEMQCHKAALIYARRFRDSETAANIEDILLDGKEVPSPSVYRLLLDTYKSARRRQQWLSTFDRLHEHHGVNVTWTWPWHQEFAYALKCCEREHLPDKACELHALAAAHDLSPRGGGAIVMRAAAKSGMWDVALKFSEDLLDPSLPPFLTNFNIALNACAKSGAGVERARLLLDHMRSRGVEPDIVSYGSAIDAGARVGDIRSAVEFYREAQDSGKEVNLFCVNAALYGIVRNIRLCRLGGSGIPETTCRRLEDAIRLGKELLENVEYPTGAPEEACASHAARRETPLESGRIRGDARTAAAAAIIHAADETSSFEPISAWLTMLFQRRAQTNEAGGQGAVSVHALNQIMHLLAKSQRPHLVREVLHLISANSQADGEQAEAPSLEAAVEMSWPFTQELSEGRKFRRDPSSGQSVEGITPSCASVANAMSSLLSAAGANLTLVKGAVTPQDCNALLSDPRRKKLLAQALLIYGDLVRSLDLDELGLAAEDANLRRCFMLALRASEYLCSTDVALRLLEKPLQKAWMDDPFYGYAWRRVLGMIANRGDIAAASRILGFHYSKDGGSRREDGAPSYKLALAALDRSSDLGQAVLIAFQKAKDGKGGLLMLDAMRKLRLPINVAGCTATIAAQRQSRNWESVLEILRRMEASSAENECFPKPTVATYNAALLVLMASKRCDEARDVLWRARQNCSRGWGRSCGSGTYGVALSACVACAGQGDRRPEALEGYALALTLYNEMTQMGVALPTERSYADLLHALEELSAEASSSVDYLALLPAVFGRIGDVPAEASRVALHLLQEKKRRHGITTEEYRTVMQILAHEGKCYDALGILNGMLKTGMKPSKRCYAAALSACHGTDARRARQVAEEVTLQAAAKEARARESESRARDARPKQAAAREASQQGNVRAALAVVGLMERNGVRLELEDYKEQMDAWKHDPIFCDRLREQMGLYDTLLPDGSGDELGW